MDALQQSTQALPLPPSLTEAPQQPSQVLPQLPTLTGAGEAPDLDPRRVTIHSPTETSTTALTCAQAGKKLAKVEDIGNLTLKELSQYRALLHEMPAAPHSIAKVLIKHVVNLSLQLISITDSELPNEAKAVKVKEILVSFESALSTLTSTIFNATPEIDGFERLSSYLKDFLANGPDFPMFDPLKHTPLPRILQAFLAISMQLAKVYRICSEITSSDKYGLQDSHKELDGNVKNIKKSIEVLFDAIQPFYRLFTQYIPSLPTDQHNPLPYEIWRHRQEDFTSEELLALAELAPHLFFPIIRSRPNPTIYEGDQPTLSKGAFHDEKNISKIKDKFKKEMAEHDVTTADKMRGMTSLQDSCLSSLNEIARKFKFLIILGDQTDHLASSYHTITSGDFYPTTYRILDECSNEFDKLKEIIYYFIEAAEHIDSNSADLATCRDMQFYFELQELRALIIPLHANLVKFKAQFDEFIHNTTVVMTPIPNKQEILYLFSHLFTAMDSIHYRLEHRQSGPYSSEDREQKEQQKCDAACQAARKFLNIQPRPLEDIAPVESAAAAPGSTG